MFTTSKGKRYLDGLAGLFVVQLGHGRKDLAEAARAQARSSPTSRSGLTPIRRASSSLTRSPDTRQET